MAAVPAPLGTDLATGFLSDTELVTFARTLFGVPT